MPKKGANISLSSYDDIFETDESRADNQLERVQKIPISELKPFQNHPFKVVDDEATRPSIHRRRGLYRSRPGKRTRRPGTEKRPPAW